METTPPLRGSGPRSSRIKLLRPDSPGARPSFPPDIERLVRYIETRLFDPELNAKVIQHRCGLRDHNTSSRFRFYVGATIRDYLEDLRLEAAVRLLRESPSTVLEVAFSVGYNNLQTFYGAFRRRFACTPAAFRHAPRTKIEESGVPAILAPKEAPYEE